jgi:cytochrome c oxidase subunit 2
MGHATYEWIYVGVVISLLTWVGADSWNIEHMLEHAPPESKTIKVIGQQWFWTFEHDDGRKEIGELHLTQGVPYRFEIVSQDVIHDFNVPDFTVLMDAVPGRVNTLWNVFDVPGQYVIQCREYCGLLHYNMRAKLFVEPPQAGQAATTQVAQASTNNNASSNVSTNTTGSNVTSQASANNTATNSSLAAPAGATLNILQGASIQGNPAYSPDPLTVKKGDTIQVTNKDSVLHTVTNGKGADDPNAGKLFDTSIINAGQSAQIATTKLTSGQQYPFHCSIHPYMTGVLKVQ